MRRSPFYAYPNFPHSFYAPPAEEPAYHHHPRRPSPSSSPACPPAPTARSVINVPVFDSAPSRPSSSPLQTHHPSAVPLIDPSSAATTIQSHFRGFCVRRHRPLLHLRSIATAHKQLEELRSELESPGFPLKVRASEKERLRFSESVMAIVLWLDAIEGSMAEVRSQRKEATKMAIKLQDAVDAIMMQRDEIADLQPTDGGMAPDEDSVLHEKSEEFLLPDVNMVPGGMNTVSEGGNMDVNPMQGETTCPEDDAADKSMSNVDNEDMVDELVAPSFPLKAEDVRQQVEAGKLGCSESVPQVKPVEVMNDAEQNSTHATGENAGSGGAEEEVNNGIDTLHFVAHNNQMQNIALVAKVDKETLVDNMKAASHDYAQEASSARSLASMDVVQEVKGGLSQDVELCPGTPTAEEKCGYPAPAHQKLLHGPSADLENQTQDNCSMDGKVSSTLLRHEYEKCSDGAFEDPSDVANPCDKAKAQSSTLSMVVTSSPPDSTLLLQLSEDCRQLRSLVGNLLAQNKAQSKVLCTLGERLELLEHQQQLNFQRNQQRMREKRKLRNGSKRSVKSRNCE